MFSYLLLTCIFLFNCSLKCAASSEPVHALASAFTQSQGRSFDEEFDERRSLFKGASVVMAEDLHKPFSEIAQNIVSRVTTCKIPGGGPAQDIRLNGGILEVWKQKQNKAPIYFWKYLGRNPTLHLSYPDVPKGKLLQKIPGEVKDMYLTRLDNNSYYRYSISQLTGPLIKPKYPFVPGDCAYMDATGSWLVTREAGKFVNVYQSRPVKRRFPHDLDTKCNVWQEAPALVFESATDYFFSELSKYYNASHEYVDERPQSLYIGRKLYELADDAIEPLECSFAFDPRGRDRLALIFPRFAMLWYLSSNLENDAFRAKGKIIAVADNQSCQFNAGVFHPNGRSLYILSNNFVWRYAIAKQKLRSFRYTYASDASAHRLMSISPQGNYLAVTDPDSGVSVLDTNTMSVLLCVLKGFVCKHITWHDDHPLNFFATSIAQDKTTEESIWQLMPEYDHASMQQCCLNLL